MSTANTQTTNATEVTASSKTIGDRLFDATFLLTILVVSGFAFSLLKAEPDLWGHVQYGRDALQDGTLHRTTTYSFTAEGYRWINHENLSELLFASIADKAGVSALLAGKCLLGMFVVGLMLWRSYRLKVSSFVAALAVLIVAVNLTGFWYIRPQVLSYTLFATLIALLSFGFHGWEGKWHLPWTGFMNRSDREGDEDRENNPNNHQTNPLDRNRLFCLAAAAVLFVIWVNTHGAFLAGLCIFLAYVFFRAFEIAVSNQPNARRIARNLLLIAGFVAAASFINPYGFKLHAWLLQSLTIPRPEIIEWHALRWGDQPFIPFALLSGFAVLGLLFSRKALDATHLAILGLTFWQAASHQRHIPFFAILCGFWLPVHWQSVWQRWEAFQASRRSPESELSGRAKLGASLGLVVLSAVLAGVLTYRCQELPVERNTYPVSAIEFMAEEDLNGRLVVTYNWAQYAIAALGVPTQDESNSQLESNGENKLIDEGEPNSTGLTTVSFDGRFRTCYPLSTIDQHFDFILGNHPQMQRYRDPESPAPNPAAILALDNPDLVLISRKQPHSVSVMESNRNDWTLLYQDELAQLWGRKEKYGEETSRNYFPSDRRDITDSPQTGTVSWPALPNQDQT